ncbi:MAG: AbrB/MazE/SpoVT family DNA-binding domain-containing protein [Acidimicrobiia bacterium]
MTTGMVRRIDDLGRVVIPAEMRRQFAIHEGDELAISVDAGNIMLRKVEAVCVFCGATEGISSFKGRGVCSDCRSALGA